MLGCMVFNATFNNIPVISWRSVFLVEELGENHRPAQVTDKLYLKCCIEYTTLVVIGTDCMGSNPTIKWSWPLLQVCKPLEWYITVQNVILHARIQEIYDLLINQSMMTHLPSMIIHEMDLISLSEIGMWSFLIMLYPPKNHHDCSLHANPLVGTPWQVKLESYKWKLEMNLFE